MSTKSGPSVGPVHRDASFRPSLAGQSGARHHLDNNQCPPRASILSKNHIRMVSDRQIRARREAALALMNNLVRSLIPADHGLARWSVWKAAKEWWHEY